VASAAGSVRGVASGATEAIRDTPETLRRQAQGNPVAVGVIAFGVGALVGSLLPKTKTEQSVAPVLQEKVVEPVKDVATEAAREVAPKLREGVQEAAREVKETAQEGAKQVTQGAHQGIDEVSSQAKDSFGSTT